MAMKVTVSLKALHSPHRTAAIAADGRGFDPTRSNLLAMKPLGTSLE
jgi:hypothetical protein